MVVSQEGCESRSSRELCSFPQLSIVFLVVFLAIFYYIIMRKIKEELKKIMPANLVAGIIRMIENKLKIIPGQEIAKNNR